jgi:hypothetical protein
MRRWLFFVAVALGAALLVWPAGASPTRATTLALAPASAYLPRPAPGALDDYHCFLLDPRVASDRWVVSAEVMPGRPAIVHHAIIFEVPPADAPAARAVAARAGGKGWTCFGGPGVPITARPGRSLSPLQAARYGLDHARWLGAWVPGKLTYGMPPGTGTLLPRGSLLVLQVHYNLTHRAQPDRSRVVLQTVPATTKLVPLETMLLPAPVELPCPDALHTSACLRSTTLAADARAYGAGSAFVPDGLLALCGQSLARYRHPVGSGQAIVTSCDRTLDRPVTIYGVAGHMHTRGRDITIELNPGTPRARVLLHIPRWSFHWQDSSQLEPPMHARAGDVVRVTCRFDNSPAAQPFLGGRQLPPRYVVWGEGTNDEMCLGILSVAYGR